MADLHEKWENLVPGFFHWFQDIYDRVSCRAAPVEDDFTINGSKSLNEELKSSVHREKSTMTGFHKKFESLRAALVSDTEKAIYGYG